MEDFFSPVSLHIRLAVVLPPLSSTAGKQGATLVNSYVIYMENVDKKALK